MEENFPFGYAIWEIWTTSQDVPFILEICRSGKPKWPYHLQSNQNFRICFVNGKQPLPPFTFLFWGFFQTFSDVPQKSWLVCSSSLRVLHKDKAPLDVGSLYWELRDSVVNCELMMLRTLQFRVEFNNPHKVICHVFGLLSAYIFAWID